MSNCKCLAACVLFVFTGGDAMAFGEEMRSVSVAAISFVPRKFDLENNAEKLEQMFRRASAGGAQIAVAPEGILEGYVVNEIIAGKAAVEDMKRVAVAIDSPMIKRFRKLARELEMCLVFGFAERVSKDVFNSAVFIDDEGQVCGKYRKMQFAEGYHPSWWFNRLGRRSRAFDTPLGRCGILICNDRWNPRLAEIPALDGAQFLVIPSFGSRSAAQDQAVLARGKENGLPVIEANVGVTLVVNKGKIAVVDRQEEAVTFGTITVGPRVKRSRKQRDKVERAFLKWRETEMVRRYNRTQSRLKNDRRE
ncbi:MAG TPA: hypothetical protein DIC23_21425 [Planctomycetaceae bacterium]|nr:hypothetical protein [Planctomycetaceae bacterium]